jgi:hypothetical protein
MGSAAFELYFQTGSGKSKAFPFIEICLPKKIVPITVKQIICFLPHQQKPKKYLNKSSAATWNAVDRFVIYRAFISQTF